MAPKPSQTLNQAFEAMGVPYDAREGLTALAVAQRVAYSLPMPDGPQGDPCEFYNAQCLPVAKEAIAGFNEASVLDFEYALTVTKLYWECRYNILFNPQSPEALAAITAMVEAKLGAIPGPTVSAESLHGLSPTGPYAALLPAVESYLNLNIKE